MVSADECMTVPIHSLLAQAAASVCRLIAFTHVGREVAESPLGRAAIRNERRCCRAYEVALKLRSGEVVRFCNQFLSPGCTSAMARDNPFFVALVVDQCVRGAFHED